MESSNPIVMIPNIFSEDYRHFEATCEQHPDAAKVVFGYVADLRAALQAFREATIGCKDEVIAGASPDAPAAAVLAGSVEGSVDVEAAPVVEEEVITRVEECCAKAVEVIG